MAEAVQRFATSSLSALRARVVNMQIGVRLASLAALGAAFGVVSYKASFLAAVLGLAGGLGVVLLLNNARVAVLCWVSLVVIAEDTSDWNIGIFDKLYQKTPVEFSPYFLLLLIAAVATFLDVRRPEITARLPRPFTPVLALVALAVIFGFINAAVGPGLPKFRALSTTEAIGGLIIAPLLVVNVIRTRRDLRRAIGFLAALTVVKAALGVVAVVAGITAVQIGFGRLSYYAPTTNWMTLVFLLGVCGAALARIRLPAWAWWSLPVVVASLVLSLRRSFWIATAITVSLLVLITSGRTTRRLLLPGIGLAVAVIYLAFATGIMGQVQGKVIRRASSVTPTKVTTNVEDRYRIAEWRNVFTAVSRQPVEGLGVGVPWPERYPVPFEYEFGHYYTHLAVLYWWMTCGLIGVAAYLLLMGSAVVTGVRLWWRQSDPLLRVAAIAIGLGVLGMMVVECVSSVVGVDVRGSAIVGVAIGLLAALYADLPTSMAS